MKIFGHPLSTCTRKLFVLLAEKHADAELVPLDLLENAHKRPEHFARHPFGVVPVLDDAGFVLYESRAILRYLDARLAGPSLTPASLHERARMDQWLSVDQSYLASHVSSLAHELLFRKHAGQAPRAELVDKARASLALAFSVIDTALAGSDYLAGPSVSLADLSLLPYIAALPMVGASALLEPHAHLRGWWARMAARPSWQQSARS